MPHWLMKYVIVVVVFFHENKCALERLTLHAARHGSHKGSLVRVAVVPAEEEKKPHLSHSRAAVCLHRLLQQRHFNL